MASADDLWLVDFGEPFAGEPTHQRPAVVLGPPDTFGPDFPFVIVCPLTTTRRGLALHVEIEPSSRTGLADTSYVQCELLCSVHGRRLVRRIGAIDLATSRHITDIVKTLLDY